MDKILQCYRRSGREYQAAHLLPYLEKILSVEKNVLYGFRD